MPRWRDRPRRKLRSRGRRPHGARRRQAARQSGLQPRGQRQQPVLKRRGQLSPEPSRNLPREKLRGVRLRQEKQSRVNPLRERKSQPAPQGLNRGKQHHGPQHHERDRKSDRLRGQKYGNPLQGRLRKSDRRQPLGRPRQERQLRAKLHPGQRPKNGLLRAQRRVSLQRARLRKSIPHQRREKPRPEKPLRTRLLPGLRRKSGRLPVLRRENLQHAPLRKNTPHRRRERPRPGRLLHTKPHPGQHPKNALSLSQRQSPDRRRPSRLRSLIPRRIPHPSLRNILTRRSRTHSLSAA
jgi:hypothetical protein